MNLNSFKRGFTKTNPEKGLHHLPGARKSDRKEEGPETIRVKGIYVAENHHTAGRVFGILSYGLAWVCNSILMIITTVSVMQFTSDSHYLGDNALIAYIALAVILHTFVIVADNLRNSDAPWARKSIITFWIGLGIFLTIYIPLATIEAFL